MEFEQERDRGTGAEAARRERELRVGVSEEEVLPELHAPVMPSDAAVE